MTRPRVEEVNYHDFVAALTKATNAGERIESSDGTRWKTWVRQNRIKEAAFRAIGKAKFDGLQPVIIDNESSWNGYYLHSTVEEVCLKWVKPGEAA